MWLGIGFILGVVLIALVFWLRSRKIAVAWYSWVLAGIGMLLLLFTIWNVSTSLAEYETVAAWNSMLVFALPAIILLAIAFLLPWWRYFRKGRGERNGEGSQLSKTTG